MNIEIVTQVVPANTKEAILCGVVKEVFIYAKILDKTCIFPIRYKIKEGKVTAL